MADPRDTVASVLNAAKVKLGQKGMTTLEPTSGKLLDWTIPGSQQVTNSAWRKLQQSLGNGGFTQLKQDVVLRSIPKVTTLDPAIPQRIGWTGFFNGTTELSSPALPFDLILPLKLWERPSGQNASFPVNPMELMFDGLPSVGKQAYNACWEWRSGAIYFPGALAFVDFRLLYQKMFPDFADTSTVQWFEQQVPINDCQEAFASFIDAEIMGTPENPNAGGWLEAGERAVRMMLNREASMKQRGNIRRQSRSGRLEGGGYSW